MEGLYTYTKSCARPQVLFAFMSSHFIAIHFLSVDGTLLRQPYYMVRFFTSV